MMKLQVVMNVSETLPRAKAAAAMSLGELLYYILIGNGSKPVAG